MQINEVVGSKGDKVGVKSSSPVQRVSISPMLRATLPITISPQNSSKGASSRNGLSEVSTFDLKVKHPLENQHCS